MIGVARHTMCHPPQRPRRVDLVPPTTPPGPGRPGPLNQAGVKRQDPQATRRSRRVLHTTRQQGVNPQLQRLRGSRRQKIHRKSPSGMSLATAPRSPGDQAPLIWVNGLAKTPPKHGPGRIPSSRPPPRPSPDEDLPGSRCGTRSTRWALRRSTTPFNPPPVALGGSTKRSLTRSRGIRRSEAHAVHRPGHLPSGRGPPVVTRGPLRRRRSRTRRKKGVIWWGPR